MSVRTLKILRGSLRDRDVKYKLKKNTRTRIKIIRVECKIQGNKWNFFLQKCGNRKAVKFFLSDEKCF